MSRRQSLDRPGILSPPGPFLTPSPSPSVSASPRLQPSPSLSPFPQDVLLVTSNTITNTTQEQERKAATPGRRQSIHQVSGSPNAGTIVFQPSPSQSPAAATTVIGLTGNEFNTTLVGSNNISLNKKGNKRTTYGGGYGQAATVNTSSSFGTTNVASSPKGQTKKATVLPTQLIQSNHQQFYNHPQNSPLNHTDSPIASPSGGIKPPTPQPMIQQIPMVNANNHQLLQFIHNPQIIAAAVAQQQAAIAQQQQQQQQRHQQFMGTASVQTTQQHTNVTTSTKSSKAPQQILPKPQTTAEKTKSVNVNHQNHTTISQSPQPQTVVTTANAAQNQAGQIILPTGNLNSQPILLNQLNQMPMLVQQNTPQGVQLILRPPTPQLATPSLVIHNGRPQMQQAAQQQLLRIVNANGAMQLATTPTFIVSSQANLIQQNLQTIKANTQAGQAVTQLSGLHAALASAPRSQQFASINGHILGQSVAHLQNLQLNGNLAQIQMPNGLNGSIISQLPPHFQQSLAGYPNINLQQIAAAAAAAGAAFQSPPPQQVGEIQMPTVMSAQNLQFSTNQQHISIASPAVTPQPQLLPSVTPEPVRNPTPIGNGQQQQPAAILVPPESLIPTAQKTPNKPTYNHTKHNETTPETKAKKTPKARRKKAAVVSQPPPAITTTATMPLTSAVMQTTTEAAQQPKSPPFPKTLTSTGKLDLGNFMKLCGIEDDDYMDVDDLPAPQPPVQEVMMSDVKSNQSDDITITNQNSEVPFSFTIPTNHVEEKQQSQQQQPKVELKAKNNDASNFVIKIDQNESGQPYTISIPRLPTAEEAQAPPPPVQTIQSPIPIQQHQAITSVPAATRISAVPTTSSTVYNNHPTPTIQSRINEIQNQLMGVTSSAAPIPQHQPTFTTISSAISVAAAPPATTTTTTTTAAVKPRRKPAVKRNGKKVDTANNALITTSVGQVPSQIGNIQISQVDATKATNQNQPMSSVVENKIQIMPILDNVVNKVQHHQQQQQHHELNKPSEVVRSVPVQQQVTIQQQQHHHQHQTPTGTSITGSITLPMSSPAPPAAAAALLSQLTGSLSLAFTEDGGRLLLRHDPNTPQDAQSQVILQAVLSGALPNVTIINEPSGEKPKPKIVTQQPAKIVLPPAITKPVQMQAQITTTTNHHPHSNETHTSNGALPKRLVVDQKRQEVIQQQSQPPVVVNPNIQKLVTLPKIDTNQQLFCLNTITNQITQIGHGQTTTTLGSMERLLIAPAGINAQQLSQCMSQGQIHFDNPINSQPQQQQPRVQQQIVQPLQPVQQPKQVANVAPIIDQSKAKLEPKTKKAKPRKPKVTNAMTSENLTKPAIKPILSTKPNTNPVQIVQPNVTKTTNSGSTSMAMLGSKKLVGITAPMQQQQQRLSNNNNQCNNTNNTSINSNNFIQATQQSTTTSNTNSVNQQQTLQQQQRSQTGSGETVPPLVSMNSAQQTVTRVQTIQLTIQQQQLLKSVQMHIQQLSAKLQNKNLLATLNIPSDFDPNNPIYNKPLPSLTNLQNMSDADIYSALQRLFIEQQKILASGKVIPTPGGFVSGPSGSFIPTQMMQQQNPQDSFSGKANNSTVLKSEGQQIPANIVQPNNHNNTSTAAAATHRIHIYPMQHHNQQNKQVVQQKTTQQMPPQILIQPKPTQFQHDAQSQLVIKQQKDTKIIAQPIIHKLPTHHHLQQQQQQQMFSNKSNATAIEVTKLNSNSLQSKQSTSNIISDGSTTPATTTTHMLQSKTILPTSNVKIPHQQQQMQHSTPHAVFTAPLESSKPKIARPSLFQRQLEVDQQGCLKPDYVTPFQSKEEAVKRLIRYHCMYQNDEEIPSDEEFELENTALEFEDKFNCLASKFQHVLVQESMLQHRTSELCLINQLLVNDLQNDLLNMRSEANNQNQEDTKPFKTEYDVGQNRTGYTNNSNSSFHIKNEIKSDKCDYSKYNSNSTHYKDVKDEVFVSNNHTYQTVFNGIKKDEHNGDYVKSYDIESEIAPSFIMKKHNAMATSSSCSQENSCALNNSSMGNFASRQSDFAVDYFVNSATNGGYPLNESIADALAVEKKKTDETSTYDEWLCLQKEFGGQTNRVDGQSKSVDKQLNEIFDSTASPKDVESQLSDLFNNSEMANGTASVKDHIHLPEFFNPDSVASKQVETRLEAMFGESPVVDKTDAADMVESRLEELFSESSSPVNNCNVMNTPQHFGSAHAPSSFAAVRRQQNLCMVNEYIEEQHQMTTTNTNPPRWMEPPEMMDAQFHDFMSTADGAGGGTSGKRAWNGELFDQHQVSKKMCFSGKVDTNMLDLHDSSTSAHDSLMHGMPHNAADIISDNSTGFPHMMSMHHHHQQQQIMHHSQMQGGNVFDQAMMHVNHMANLSGSSGMSSNFEDDINRHVQNAIDSILNLQNSESDSLNFSLDQSMGSFLGDGTLDQNSQSHHVGGTIVQTPTSHCSLNSLTAGLNNSIAGKRRTRMDDLGDCLISGGGDNSNMMVDSPSSVSGGAVANTAGGVDFCVTGIEEAVKSILSS